MSSPAPQQREELRRLHERYLQSSDPGERDRLRERLVAGYEGLVHFLARRFQNRGEPLEDIVQVGFLGLIKAIDRFDPSLGNEFTTFATPTILGEIKRYFRDKGWAIRFPRRLQELYQQVVRVNEEMKNQLGRQPSMAEVAERLGVEPDNVLEAMEMSSAFTPVSIDATLGGDGDDDGRQLSEAVGGEDPNLDRVEMRQVLDKAMQYLNERERRIMIMRFFDEMSQSEVAKRLGISQMHVSRLQRAALEHLREHLPSESA
ncbi:MAG: B/F/G family RNA polymerase sigma-70 factor [Candidatus Nephthysia bennettiae]|uniref:RNA polymerase sigma factor n=1 Tax=Candidatus Nephthysia bennettiae TaxID=3127016 RepID=A0A934N584_9BACT|nr:SigB/SigF/SigG family RNA polymerase sigma factor [Candidatus Dormibacteraeota bacterium]MBJ7611157.1 SigB/SigF/SigG family RNA polymerase sigma factor [Candidatus Dormibacteraeota bacterium]PZR90639.1 MAG: B/F/G family RNA polymerase sigma-70 factor [Candidatus Dormibacteraeota bacterium]